MRRLITKPEIVKVAVMLLSRFQQRNAIFSHKFAQKHLFPENSEFSAFSKN
jgi:hypothetical protein